MKAFMLVLATTLLPGSAFGGFLKNWLPKRVCIASISEAPIVADTVDSKFSPDQPKVAAMEVEDHLDVRSAGLLPRGAAIVTTSGFLENQGIRHIIHAASGSMTKAGAHFDPTLAGVVASVKNSIFLARAHGHSRVALPFIGGKVFIERIGMTAEALSDAIVRAALEVAGGVEIRFVTFGAVDSALFENSVAKYAKDLPPDLVAVTPGSIVDFKIHGATAIVNAANMEAAFGGGLSRIIADATRHEKEINAEASREIRLFYEGLRP